MHLAQEISDSFEQGMGFFKVLCWKYQQLYNRIFQAKDNASNLILCVCSHFICKVIIKWKICSFTS